jgi:hypothetical protein
MSGLLVRSAHSLVLLAGVVGALASLSQFVLLFFAELRIFGIFVISKMDSGLAKSGFRSKASNIGCCVGNVRTSAFDASRSSLSDWVHWKEVCNCVFEVAPHSCRSLIVSNCTQGSLETSIIVLDRINEVSNPSMLVWKLVGDVLRTGSHGNVGIAMLLRMALQQIIALPFPFPRMKKIIHFLDLHLPFILSSLLARKSQPGASVLLGSLKRFNRIGVSRATCGLLELIIEFCVIVLIQRMIMGGSCD